MKTNKEEVTETNKRFRLETSPQNLTEQSKGPAIKKKKTTMDISAFEALLDKKLKPLATKDDLNNFKKIINDVVIENKAMKEEILHLKAANRILINKVDDLENRGRRNNLLFWGLSSSDKADCVGVIKEFCKNQLQLESDLQINRAHFLQATGSKKAIIAHLPRDSDIHSILRNCNKLAGTKISVQRDFSLTTRKKRARLLSLLKEVKYKTECKVKLSRDMLIVNGTQFSMADDLEGLLHREECGFEKFHELTGLEAAVILHNFEKNNEKRK